MTGSSPGGRFVGVAVGLGSAIDAAVRESILGLFFFVAEVNKNVSNYFGMSWIDRFQWCEVPGLAGGLGCPVPLSPSAVPGTSSSGKLMFSLDWLFCLKNTNSSKVVKKW